jgi:hypothetical protein
MISTIELDSQIYKVVACRTAMWRFFKGVKGGHVRTGRVVGKCDESETQMNGTLRRARHGLMMSIMMCPMRHLPLSNAVQSASEQETLSWVLVTTSSFLGYRGSLDIALPLFVVLRNATSDPNACALLRQQRCLCSVPTTGGVLLPTLFCTLASSEPSNNRITRILDA